MSETKWRKGFNVVVTSPRGWRWEVWRGAVLIAHGEELTQEAADNAVDAVLYAASSAGRRLAERRAARRAATTPRWRPVWKIS